MRTLAVVYPSGLDGIGCRDSTGSFFGRGWPPLFLFGIFAKRSSIMDYDADDTDRSLILTTNGVANWQEIIVKHSRVNRNLQFHQLVTVVESGKWPTPEEIELLRAEIENMRFTLQVPVALSRDDIEIDLEPEEFTLVSQFCEHCQMMVRIVSGLAMLARYSLRDTESLLRLEPLAWSRLLAEARFYQNSSISQTEQAIQTPSPRSHQSRAWPGCNDWHNWGIGVDENGRWHLYHFHRARNQEGCFGWKLHRHAKVHIASGAMEEAARTLVSKGCIELRGSRGVNELKSTISRLRSTIKKAVAKEGFRPEGVMIVSPTKERLVWTPIVRFGTVVKRERHTEFRLEDF